MSKSELVSKMISSSTRGAFVGFAFIAIASMSGCISDTDCGVCDPDTLVLESISGINYANRKIHLLTEGVSKGKYFIKDIGACVETPEAKEAVRGAEEWCKLSPLVSVEGLEFVFNNLLDPTSVELVRKDPSDPNLFQIYDWKSQIASIEGPITRYNGDYVEQAGEAADVMTRAINLTCVDNLRAMGQDLNHEILDANPDICNGFHEVDGRKIPLKMQASGTTKSYPGETDWRALSCSSLEDVDVCCTVCDYELSVNVAKYGVVSEGGSRRTPSDALACDPNGNVYEDCADFITGVNRETETNRYSYEWDGSIDTFRLPLSDKIRETHPDLRPAGVEPGGEPCSIDADCDAALGSDSGAVCIGVTPGGVTCGAGTEDCGNMHCKAEWFVTCGDGSNTTGGSYCVDKRFKDDSAGACYVANSDFESCVGEGDNKICTTWSAGKRLARCDSADAPNGDLTAAECCQSSLGGEAQCDPLFQEGVSPIARFDRDQTLPEETRSCFCGDPSGQPGCEEQIQKFCTSPWGSLERHDGTSNEGQYITRFVTKPGGVYYDPALKGVLYLPGDRGNQPRSLVESCAEGAQSPDLIEGRNVQDGWRMHDTGVRHENYENFDRGMCSASEYRVVFADEGQQIRGKAGNLLEPDKRSYVFETAEFHVIPDTGEPKDNLRIGACDDFELQLSNKYDLDPQNLQKIELVQIRRVSSGEDSTGESCSTSFAPECWEEDFVVAGGLSCTNNQDEISDSTPPCLTVDVSNQHKGAIRVGIDNIRFGAQLFTSSETDPQLTGRYRMRIPGLREVEHFDDLDLDDPDDLAAYNRAFHDVCGMPLITEGGQGYTDFYYDFTIDPPKCKEDQDGDQFQRSCDNAPDYFNPDQFDDDLDGHGNVWDLCSLTPSSSNTSDSDSDAVGNDCDTCREPVDAYNLEGAMLDNPRLWVRNIPFQFDTDQDGIGDVCDNCVTYANCSAFGPNNPHTVGRPVPYEDTGVCQTDTNVDMIGDACINPDTAAPYDNDFAAGPVGFENPDDFDQDGIINLEDFCPRQPVAAVSADVDERTACTDNAECGAGSSCAATAANDGLRYCNHADFDGDQVGDYCDTCPFDQNPMQVSDTGMQLDDPDADFVGNACETNSACYERKDARPYAFMEVAVNGSCCSTSYPGDGVAVQNEDGTWGCEGLCDPDGFPIKLVCENEAIPGEDVPDGTNCRQLTAAVASSPGVVNLPEGCAEALEAARMCAPQGGVPNEDCPEGMANRALTLLDIEDEDELWSKMCFLPQWDQDFDGIGDACDMCTFSYDPFNEIYLDENGKLWEGVGKYCQGAYAPDAVCAAKEPEKTETGTGTDGGTSGG